MRKLLLTCIAMAALAAPGLAPASIMIGAVKPKAQLSGDGERARVKVFFACDHEQSARLKVTVSQGSANEQERALGTGRETIACGTEQSTSPVAVRVRKGTFAPGKATACVLALTSDDARQWCVEVKLRTSPRER